MFKKGFCSPYFAIIISYSFLAKYSSCIAYVSISSFVRFVSSFAAAATIFVDILFFSVTLGVEEVSLLFDVGRVELGTLSEVVLEFLSL